LKDNEGNQNEETVLELRNSQNLSWFLTKNKILLRAPPNLHLQSQKRRKTKSNLRNMLKKERDQRVAQNQNPRTYYQKLL
jgi:hypothetical protein